MSHLQFELVKFLVSFLNLLVQGLILNLQLLVIDQVKTISQLFLLTENFLLVSKLIPQGNILESVLVDLLVFSFISFLPLLDHLKWKFLSGSGVLSVHGYTLFQLLKLLLNLHAFLLFLIEFVLEFTSHTIVSLLCLLQVVTDLMDICKSVEILVLVEHLVCLFLRFLSSVLHQDNLFLELLVLPLELLILVHLVMNSLNEFSLHDWLGRQVSNVVVIVFITEVFIL